MNDEHALSVRNATIADTNRLMEVFDAAKRFMRLTGNSSQWTGGYPDRALVERDIAGGHCYVVESNGCVVGTFCLIHGDDPTYAEIDGAWTDDGPYATIHRIASDGSVPGVADRCLEFAMERTPSLRIDTHAENKPMLRWAESRGFTRCGVIRIADGSPRTAFQLTDRQWTHQAKSK